MNQDIINEIRKEAAIQVFKQLIRTCYPPLYAEAYCHQIDGAKYFAKWIEAIRNSQ